MREIKFRVPILDKNNELWHFHYWGFIDGKFVPRRNEWIGMTVGDDCQFTGLNDKNGKEIYEGDIVKWGHARDFSREMPVRVAEVRINPDIQFHSQVGVFNFGRFIYAGSTDKDLEIVGNIYEDKKICQN